MVAAVPCAMADRVVVAEHPRRRRADVPDRLGGVVDHAAHALGVPRCLQGVEVERTVQLVRAEVTGQTFRRRDPCLGDERAGAAGAVGVLVGDLTPASMDVVHLIAVPMRMAWVLVGRLTRDARVVHVGQGVVLGHRVGDVDAEAVDAAVEPEAQDRVELLDNLCVIPVPIRLADVEQVEIPLTVVDAFPGRPSERGGPAIGRLRAGWTVGAFTEPEQVPLGRPRGPRRAPPGTRGAPRNSGWGRGR